MAGGSASATPPALPHGAGATSGTPASVTGIPHIMLAQARPVWQAVAPPPEQQGWPIAPQVPQVPGMPMLLIRPAQPRPVVHVPLLPEPQHDCPMAPQGPHWFPAVATTQPRSVMQAVVAPPPVPPPPIPPPPIPPPIVVGQQAWPAPPQLAHMPGMPMLLIRPVQAIPALQVPFPTDPQQG